MSRRSDQAIVDLSNELAREFYNIMGYQVPAGYKFDSAHHPQEVMCWCMAVTAIEMIEGTEVGQALDAVNE